MWGDFMDYKLMNIDLGTAKDNSAMHKTYLEFYNLSKEAISNNEYIPILRILDELPNEFERIENFLEIDKDENKSIFYFGMISGIANLLSDLGKEKTENIDILNLFKKYRLLYSVLNTINEEYTLSGQELKQDLNFKSESNLSNFMRRIEPYNLIYIQKLGKTNYYTLTAKGKKYLTIYEDIEENNEKFKTIDENIIILLLEQIANQSKTESPNLMKVLSVFSNNNITLKNFHMMKLKINSIFSSRDEYVKRKIVSKLEKYENDENKKRMLEDQSEFHKYNFNFEFKKRDEKFEYFNYVKE